MNSRKRHIAKTLTWRAIASITTFILTFIFFRDDPNATQKATWVVLTESVLKMVIYYYHERVWFLNKSALHSGLRHLFKTVTWRITASITTFAVTFVIFNDDPNAIQKASGVAIIETFIKMLLYYFHERAWYVQDMGIEDTRRSRKCRSKNEF